MLNGLGISRVWVLNSWTPHLGSYHDQEPLGSGLSAPVGTREAHVEVGGRLSNAMFCSLPLLYAPYPLYSMAPTQFLLGTHTPRPLPSAKGVIGPEKAELTGILNDDTL